MSRINNISLKKRILVEIEHNKLKPAYLKIIRNLSRKFDVLENKSYSNLVNFKKNKDKPIHSWFDYKQGYSDQLVKRVLINENPSKELFILDPFVGVGTTCMVAKEMGYNSIGYDINPVATLASGVKTENYNYDDIKKIKHYIKNFKPIKSDYVPTNIKVLNNSFSNENFAKLMEIKGFYEKIYESKIKNFFRLAYISIVEDCSNRKKDGNGIKIAKNKIIVNDVFKYFLHKSKQMLNDVSNLKKNIRIDDFINPKSEFINNNKKDKHSNVKTIIINESFLDNEKSNKYNNLKIGGVIFSPPYANCFDYFEVYKLEMWMGGFVNKYNDFSFYRNKAIRSHVNSSFDHKITNFNTDVDIISSLISCYNIWNKNIPDMIRGYFDDMRKVIKKLNKLMVKNSNCYIIVGNSGYRGILVPTDLLLADIADKEGFIIKKIISTRLLRSSSQQMKDLHNNYKNLMRESIVVIKKT